jgi:ADP-ribose pyrophosphatase
MPSGDSGEQVVTLASERRFQGRVVSVRVDRIRLPGGGVAVREVAEHRDAVAVVALDDGGRVTLVRQYRHPASRVLLELPAGLREAGEDAEACARRELLEETGLEADRLERLGGCYPSAGFSTEFIELFLATGVGGASGAPKTGDGDEAIVELVRLPVAQAVEMATSGPIVDAKTILGLLLAERRLSR